MSNNNIKQHIPQQAISCNTCNISYENNVAINKAFCVSHVQYYCCLQNITSTKINVFIYNKKKIESHLLLFYEEKSQEVKYLDQLQFTTFPRTTYCYRCQMTGPCPVTPSFSADVHSFYRLLHQLLLHKPFLSLFCWQQNVKASLLFELFIIHSSNI